MINKSTQFETNRTQLEMVTLDELVPKDHLVRKIESAIDFEFIYPMVQGLYSEDRGRPSVDPVVLIKMVFVQYLFGIRSMRQTIRGIETNLAYRWFLGLGFSDKVPHFSIFGKNYVRRFQDTTLFEDIFNHILDQAVDAGFVDSTILFVDSTHVKANANKRKLKKKIVQKEAHSYREHLAADSAYKTAPIAKLLIDRGILPALPYTRPKGPKGTLRKNDFVYDEYFNVFLCPNNQTLDYRTTTRDGKRVNMSPP